MGLGFYSKKGRRHTSARCGGRLTIFVFCAIVGRSESRQRGSFPGDLTWENVNNVDVVFISQVPSDTMLST